MIARTLYKIASHIQRAGGAVAQAIDAVADRLSEKERLDQVAQNAEEIEKLKRLVFQFSAHALRTEFNANLETVARLAKDNQHRQTLNEGVDGKLGQSIATLAHRVEQLQLWRDNSGGGDKLVHTVVELARRLGVVERLFEHEGVTEFFEKMPGNLATVMSMVEENQRRLDKLDPEKPDDYDGEVYP